MVNKIRVGILFGGCSAEHEVSLQSAKNVFDALDKSKYEPVLIGIDKSGQWHVSDSSNYLLNSENPKLIKLNKTNKEIALIPGKKDNQLIVRDQRNSMSGLDVVFPILHGPLGEDGTIQGMLRLANLPFVGSSVLGSAICMDKDVTKRLLAQAGLPVCKYLVLKKAELAEANFDEIEKKLGLPFFVKPANMGSSVGVVKVSTKTQFDEALQKSFSYDHKVLIEEAIIGRELEIALLGNEIPMPSGVGEILPQGEFYSYEAKYIDEHGAILEIPANIASETESRIKELAVSAFKTLECAGLARCDFFLRDNGELFINEINSIPGLTKISMYPKLWDMAGISYSDLIDKLLQLAIQRHKTDKALKTTF
jgi:D-alanine-D-alanine ligase